MRRPNSLRCLHEPFTPHGHQSENIRLDHSYFHSPERRKDLPCFTGQQIIQRSEQSPVPQSQAIGRVPRSEQERFLLREPFLNSQVPATFRLAALAALLSSA